ncbi:MAG: uracil phosphoribosyltransferase [Chloroflexota bacterium]|nr:uracil phosphoribosyltransferase [Chloroflexota bacterium]
MRAVSTEPKKFREVVREITSLLMYEATLDLETREIEVETPLGVTMCKVLTDRIGFVPILRAGVGMVDSALDMIPTAQVWHIGLYRDHRTLLPVEYYNKLPVQPTVDICYVLDPMLATAGSATATVKVLKDWGARKIKYVGLIAAPEGVTRFHAEHPDVPIYVASVDSHLNSQGYIVPGLGDAGDRQFGTS